MRDVLTVEATLKKTNPPAKITLLTARKAPGDDSDILQEPPERVANKANLTSALQRIISNSQPGDFVYFHYAGHGTRKSTESAKYRQYSHARGNVALVLYPDQPEHSLQSEYFKGANLAIAFNQMVAKGLRLTVILDCCYSGSVLRDDAIGSSIREVAYKYAIEAAHQSPEMDAFCQHSDIQRSSLSPDQWLIDANGYIIFAACGPHEVAREIKMKGTEHRHGALSYFLMKALASVSNNATQYFTYQSLYSHLRVLFQAHWPQQTPMMYGKSEHAMFGHSTKLAIRDALCRDQSISVFWPKDEHNLHLNAGEAHLVQQGDEYDLRPCIYEDDATEDMRATSIRVKVAEVRALTSILVGINPRQDISCIETGWLATNVSPFPGKKIFVRFSPIVASLLGSKEPVASHIFVVQTGHQENASSQASLYHVQLDSNNVSLEILDATLDKIPGIPTIRAHPSSKQRLWDILEHMATFKLLEQVEKPPVPEFRDKFAIRASTGEPHGFVDTTFLEVQHGQDLIFSVENYEDQPLYLALFNFTSNWEVSNIFHASGSGEFYVLQPQRSVGYGSHEYENKARYTLTMSIPEGSLSQGLEDCIETFKFFVSTKATTFPKMVLSDISDRFKHEDHRSADSSFHDDEIWNTLQSLQQASAPSRDDNSAPKPEQWASKSYVVRILRHVNKGESGGI